MLDAIIVAGSPNTGPLRECSDENYEAMIKIGYKPMVRYVVDALLASSVIEKVVIAGPAELRKAFPEEAVHIVETRGPVIENAIKAMEKVDTSRPILIATCDIPLLTAKAVEDFVKTSWEKDGDFFYPIVSMDDAARRFPGVTRTSVKLQEGTFTGGNLFVVNPAVVRRSAGKAQEFVDYRKSPFHLCRLLGMKFVFKLLFNCLTIPELEKKVSELFGLKARAVITAFPEIGIDVDKPSDYSVVSAYLDKPA